MKLVLPTDCGNAPRIAIVGEFVTNWAKRDAEAMTAWLTDDVTWTVAGRETACEFQWKVAAISHRSVAANSV